MTRDNGSSISTAMNPMLQTSIIARRPPFVITDCNQAAYTSRMIRHDHGGCTVIILVPEV
jgi:hypothetical protein